MFIICSRSIKQKRPTSPAPQLPTRFRLTTRGKRVATATPVNEQLRARRLTKIETATLKKGTNYTCRSELITIKKPQRPRPFLQFLLGFIFQIHHTFFSLGFRARDHHHGSRLTRLVLDHLESCLHHHVHSTLNHLLGDLRIQSYPITHKSTFREQNLNKITNIFFSQSNHYFSLSRLPSKQLPAQAYTHLDL
jgi:hypothetical protein